MTEIVIFMNYGRKIIMKITIETIDSSKAKMTLQINGKEYSETWLHDNEEGVYRTEGKGITVQMEEDDIDVDGTDLEEYLTDVDVSCFIDIAECEDFYYSYSN
jgi:hypothetical protein